MRTFLSVQEGWVWPVLFSPGPQHVGPVGLTASQWSRPTQSSQKTCSTLWMIGEGVHVDSASESRDHLIRMGFLAPSWVDVANGARPRREDDWEDVPRSSQQGWQHKMPPWCLHYGTPHRRAAEEDGAVLRATRRRMERTYPELSGRFGRARLVVLACEVGGRWSEETNNFLLQLAKAKARGVPQPLKTSAKQSWLMRWRSILACAAAKAFAQPLLEQRGGTGVDGPTPSLTEVMSDSRHCVFAA